MPLFPQRFVYLLGLPMSAVVIVCMQSIVPQTGDTRRPPQLPPRYASRTLGSVSRSLPFPLFTISPVSST